tara:strand:- start:1118 stop:1900 length:783 start_codon:yes stop_codon:yes gene_type:complete
MKCQKTIFRVFFIGIIFLLSACKSVAVLPSKTPVKKVDVSALASKIKANFPKINKLRSRIRAIYDDGKREQQVIIQLRLETQQKIWMSASMVIPIAKLVITKEGISFYEKFQKNFFKGDFRLINEPFNTSFSFNDIENLLLGKPFLDPTIGRWKQISNPQYYILIPQGRKSTFQPTLFFDPTSFLLKEQRFLIPGSLQTLIISYKNHQRIQDMQIPQEIEIALFDGEQTKKVTLDFTRTELPNKLYFPFEIPEGYNQISF